MPNVEKPIRQSVSLPPRVARRVKALARTQKTSANRAVVDLIEAGRGPAASIGSTGPLPVGSLGVAKSDRLEAQEREKKRFFDLADRLARSSDPEQQKQLKEDLARMTFGE